ncbi:MAG: hypothetical protein A2270_10590 [Elusimicrobia bacterium RIFOXYA12_FULL_51_18]|nr:MAG: hypothetical protein A2270_10590 [Elusimicrobia bacterium RIFOXYA12_FULL_51_18]OGS29488.1 MAG: hypothetical protein A2218_00600 [Elusimicrobia bacterium RIFOXYA2_FULL_53_38]
MEQKSTVRNTEDIRHILSEEILMIKAGKSTPSRANAISNLVAKILASAKLDIEFHRYVQKANAKDISMALVKDGNKPAELPNSKHKG